MFEEADQYLKEWLATILPGTRVELTAPQEVSTGEGVSLYLMDLEAKPFTHESLKPAWQVGLNYLVTTWAEQPEVAHRLLGELVFAALEKPEFEVELNSLPVESWTCYRLIPRPYFVLKFPVRKPRQLPAPKYVTQPLSVKNTGVTKLYGLAIGPGDVPISGAQVIIPALRQVQYTDMNGRFSFPLFPGPLNFRTVRIKVKNQVQEVTPDPHQPTSEKTPLVIRFDLPEE